MKEYYYRLDKLIPEALIKKYNIRSIKNVDGNIIKETMKWWMDERKKILKLALDLREEKVVFNNIDAQKVSVKFKESLRRTRYQLLSIKGKISFLDEYLKLCS